MRYEIELTKETKAEINKRLALTLEYVKNDIVNDIVENCPVKTGFTRNTINGEVKDDTIIISVGGAIFYIEFGTPPHDIRPKDKQALFWEGAGHPVKIVHHPGTMPNPIVITAIYRGLLVYLPKRLKEVFEWAG
jgi:hypothetical protein